MGSLDTRLQSKNYILTWFSCSCIIQRKGYPKLAILAIGPFIKPRSGLTILDSTEPVGDRPIEFLLLVASLLILVS